MSYTILNISFLNKQIYLSNFNKAYNLPSQLAADGEARGPDIIRILNAYIIIIANASQRIADVNT